jgi:ABC-type branched-subunit amino acid transport system ATPase component
MIARKAITYTPQEQTLFQDLTVEDNLRLGLRNDRAFVEGLARVSEYFPIVGKRLSQKAGTLSGGEQRMLIVSRALLGSPRLMMIDEISEGLQPSIIQRLTEILLAERERTGTAIFIVEQNVPFAFSMADRYPLIDIRVDEHSEPISELRRVLRIGRKQLMPFVAGMPKRGAPAEPPPLGVTQMLLRSPPDRPGGGGSRGQ